MRSNRGYHSYRGRPRTGKVLLVVVLVLLLLLSGGYLLLQDHIVYESDGSISLDLPFLQRKENKEEEQEDVNLEILPPDGSEGESDGDTAQPVTNALSMTAQTLCAQGLPESGYNAVAVEMKGFNGTFQYSSRYAASKALATDAVSQTQVTEALSAAGEDLNLVAQVGCFHDSFHAFADMTGSGICQSGGYIWYDDLRSHWMDPAKEGTRTYMAQVANECVSMGFTEILLTDFTYPTTGDLSQIDYSHLTVTKSEALTGFLTSLRESLPEGVKLSVELTEEQILGGADETSGVDAAAIAPLVDRIYLPSLSDEAAVREVVGQQVGLVVLTNGTDGIQAIQ